MSDPLTGEDRALSDIDSPTLLAEFRQDLTEREFAWGFSYRAPRDSRSFFVDEESFTTDGSEWAVFVETTKFFGVRANLAARSIGRRNFFRERLLFDPDRSGELLIRDVINRDRGAFVTLTLSGQF